MDMECTGMGEYYGRVDGDGRTRDAGNRYTEQWSAVSWPVERCTANRAMMSGPAGCADSAANSYTGALFTAAAAGVTANDAVCLYTVSAGKPRSRSLPPLRLPLPDDEFRRGPLSGCYLVLAERARRAGPVTTTLLSGRPLACLRVGTSGDTLRATGPLAI